MNKVRIKEDIIYNENALTDITLIHLSDIHFNLYTKEKKLLKIKEMIYLANPDYVLITGDLLDTPDIVKNKYKIKELLSFLTSISDRFKVLISLGNHDVFSESDFKFFNKLNDLKNIYILNDDYYKDENIFIGGVTLPNNYYYNITRDESDKVLVEHLINSKKLVNRLPRNIPKVLMIHSPIRVMDDMVINKLKDYDLILSGHTHGGMMPPIMDKIFKGNYGIIAPNKRIAPKVARGRIDKYVNNKKITLIISSGITKLSIKSSKLLSKLNFIYNIDINKIIITKKRGKYYE